MSAVTSREIVPSTIVIGLDDDAFGVDLIDDAVAARDHHRARIARRHLFHTGADKRRFARAASGTD